MWWLPNGNGFLLLRAYVITVNLIFIVVVDGSGGAICPVDNAVGATTKVQIWCFDAPAN